MLVKMRILANAAAIAALLSATNTVQAQAWIGLMVGDMMAQQQAAAARQACMTGAPMASAEVTESLAPTNALMHAYFAAMQGGAAARSSFYLLDRKARWNSGEHSLRMAELDGPPDPFAVPGHVIDAQPNAYFRSGMEAWTLAQWQVRDGAGALVGTYTGFFVRNIGDWKIRELTLTPANEYVEPARQFCFAPGDVLPYRSEYSARARVQAEREVVRAEGRLSRETARLADAERALAQRPDNTSRQERVAAARDELAEKQAALSARRTALTNARAEESAVAAELADATRLREEGTARLQAGR